MGSVEELYPEWPLIDTLTVLFLLLESLLITSRFVFSGFLTRRNVRVAMDAAVAIIRKK